MDAWRRYQRALGDGTVLPVLSAAATAVRDDPAADADARELLLTWVLDAELRRATHDRRTWTDVVSEVGSELEPDELSGAIAAVVGHPLTGWEAQAAGTERLDLGPALQWWGLSFTDDAERRVLGPDPGASPLAARRRASWAP